jgi:hypothetical protein
MDLAAAAKAMHISQRGQMHQPPPQTIHNHSQAEKEQQSAGDLSRRATRYRSE